MHACVSILVAVEAPEDEDNHEQVDDDDDAFQPDKQTKGKSWLETLGQYNLTPSDFDNTEDEDYYKEYPCFLKLRRKRRPVGWKLVRLP